MIEKLHRPEFLYLTQGYSGDVSWHLNKPTRDKFIGRWISDHSIIVSGGAINHDWETALIDTNAGDSYTFEGGILKRVPAEGGDLKEMYKL